MYTWIYTWLRLREGKIEKGRVPEGKWGVVKEKQGK